MRSQLHPVLIAAALALTASVARAETRYAQANLVIDGNKVSSVNYRLDNKPIIPIGTPVKVVKYDGRKIKVRRLDNQFEFWFVNHKSSKQSDSVKVLGWFFNRKNPASKIKRFPASHRRAIKAGKLITGMSKAAVLLAIGPPPPHKTPSQKGNTWMYWRGSFSTFVLSFENGKLKDFPSYLGKKLKVARTSKPKAQLEKDKPEPKAQYRFATSNFYVLKKKKLYWNNYISGEKAIPFNSKVKALITKSDEIHFKVIKSGRIFVLNNKSSKSGMDTLSLFHKLFAAKDQRKRLRKLSDADRRNAKRWRVKTGMGKAAVLLAVGPPGAGDTNSDVWVYEHYRGWLSYSKMIVEFNRRGRVQDILF